MYKKSPVESNTEEVLQRGLRRDTLKEQKKVSEVSGNKEEPL